MRQSLRGFTLVELLVVVAIIVVLLSMMIGGLERALKAAVRTRCGANQRALAQAAAIYAMESKRTFPMATSLSGKIISFRALQVRVGTISGTASVTDKETQHAGQAVGLGHLVASRQVAGTTRGGELLHCPSLDTEGGAPANYGMDKIYTFEETGPGGDVALTNQNDRDRIAGTSFWSDPSQVSARIYSGYLYRALSYYWSHNNGAIRTNEATASFGMTCDLVGYGGEDSTAIKYGRKYHHKTGWMVTFGDGHVDYVQDPEGSFRGGPFADKASWKGFVEKNVANVSTTNASVANPILGGVGLNDEDSQATERVFTYFGAKTIP